MGVISSAHYVEVTGKFRSKSIRYYIGSVLTIHCSENTMTDRDMWPEVAFGVIWFARSELQELSLWCPK